MAYTMGNLNLKQLTKKPTPVRNYKNEGYRNTFHKHTYANNFETV